MREQQKYMHNEKRIGRHYDAKFDSEGEPLDDGRNRYRALDAYLQTEPGTPEALEALKRVPR